MKLLMSRLKLVIPEKIFETIMYWINKAPGEISGVGNLLQDPDDPHVYRVTATVLTKQTNTGASTEFDGDAHGEAMFRLHKQPGVARWYWHSHANFGVFWSGTDTGNMEQFDQEGFTFETVINKAREIRTAYVQGRPFLVLDEVPCVIESAFILAGRDLKFCQTEYDRNVIIPRPNQTRFGIYFPRDRGHTPNDEGVQVPNEVYFRDGLWHDFDGNEYEAVEDEYQNIWLHGAKTFRMEDTDDVTADITRDEFSRPRESTAGGNGCASTVTSQPAQTSLPLVGGANKADASSEGAGSSAASRDAGTPGGTDSAAHTENPYNGGGSWGHRVIHSAGALEDGVREPFYLRSRRRE